LAARAHYLLVWFLSNEIVMQSRRVIEKHVSIVLSGSIQEHYNIS